MYELSKGSVSAGHKKIADRCKMIDSKLTHDYCREIKKQLEKMEIIETKGTRTIIKRMKGAI